MLGTAHGSRRIHANDLSDDQVIKEHPDGGEMLFDSGSGQPLAEFLDVSRDDYRLKQSERQVAPFTPATELADGTGVNLACVRIADVRGEEFEETPRCV